ncbi:MAG: biotin carboxylase N-terminal domain-containing protein [Bacteroidota bacterium]
METLTINTILIANRGEIASRIIRTCKKMGIRSIAVFSNADKDMPYVGEADMAVNIGEANPAASYLDQQKIINTAIKYKADAIHPGYGFLSENAAFAEKCQSENVIFIGPNPEAIEAMGSKSAAKKLMTEWGVPVIPGYQGEDQTTTRLREEAQKIGFPVLLKATAGGGGKGMRIVHSEKEIASAIDAAKREAQNAFGNDELIIEKYIASGRHIEFQVFGDKHGNVIHILERECTIQRRYQKIIEESPSPVMTDTLRTAMGESAISAAKALDYDNAGTVEFIFDESTNDYYFLEVNTRLQVEHPVTEAITGLDLVEMQVESAQGFPLRVTQDTIQSSGYAIEARLYSEDPTNNFLPVSGMVSKFKLPKVDGLRVESAIISGSEISIYYDPMIAKLIVWDTNRSAALRKMHYVLENMVCLGITTNQDLLVHLLANEKFRQGQYDTHFIDSQIDLSNLDHSKSEGALLAGIAGTIYNWRLRKARQTKLTAIPSGWRNNFYEYQKDAWTFGETVINVQYRFRETGFLIIAEGLEHEAQLISFKNDHLILEIDGLRQAFDIVQRGPDHFIHTPQMGPIHLVLNDRFPAKETERTKGTYLSPMPSQVVKLLVSKGDEVKAGQGLIVLSSMKMENTINADEDGTVEEIYVEENANIEADITLLKITPIAS